MVAGVSLVAVATLAPRRRFTFAAHVWAGSMLVALAAVFTMSGAWTGTSNYLVLGLGIVLAPLLSRTRAQPAWLQGEAFSLVIGFAGTLTGLLMLIMPDQFRASTYDLIRPHLVWFGLAFTGSGLLLSASHTGRLLPIGFARWAPVLVASTFFAFGSATAVPSHTWTGIAYYGGFGAVLIVLSWMGPRLRRIDPGSLRARLALVLAAAAAVPLLVLVPLYANEEENWTVSEVLASQQLLTAALAQDVANYIDLHQAAVKLLAGQPALLALSPAEQHAVLKNARAAFPDVVSFGTVSADGQPIARADDLTDTSWIGSPVFQEIRRTNQPTVDVLVSPVIDRPIFLFGVPILDAEGRFVGMVSSSLESSRIAAFLNRTDLGADARTYLIDATGRVLAHTNLELLESLANLSAEPFIATFLNDPSTNGSAQIARPNGAVLASYARVPDRTFVVIVERPTAAALAPTYGRLSLLFGGLLVAIGAAAGFGLLAAGWLSQPLATLGAAVESLTVGEESSPLPTGGPTEVAGLAVAFGTMRARVIGRTAELTAANQELEAFSYSVSHDLRAPLRAIDGFSRILLQEHAAQLAPEAQRYLELVCGNAHQMGRLIDDLLSFSRLSRQGLRSDRVLPAELVREALDGLAFDRQGRSVEVVVGELLPCRADPALLKQLFVNLLSNALKFTRHRVDSHIEIASSELDGEVVYSITDDGAGFDMKYANKLFGVFQRLHRAEDYEGTGVGLAIAQRIVHRHGGRIWANGVLGHGATFSFTLPSAHTTGGVR
jgi:signal transduction histidine kinase